MPNDKAKYRIYIDEVGNNDLNSSNNPNHRYLSLTGVIFELDYVLKVLNPAIENLKRKYFDYHPDEPVIFHRKEIINKKYPFNILEDPKTEEAFEVDFLALLVNLQFKVISVLIDKLEHKNKYSVWKYDPYHYCMEILVERFHFLLNEIESVGDFMVESRGGKEDIRLKKSFRHIMENGTHFVDSEKLNSNITSKELKVKQKILNISGLQIADLIAFPVRKYIFAAYSIVQDNRITFNDRIIEVIKEKFYKKNNLLEGFGIKLLP